MEAMIAAQKELFGRIGRTLENLKKTEAAKITSPLIDTTLALLDQKWEKKTALLELQETLAASKTEPARAANDHAVDHVTPPPRTTLPRIQLPNFSGNYEDWPAFRDLFVSLITKDPLILDVTRLHYLKASLRGEADMLVRNLPTTDENFRRAWQILVNYYENTRLLVRSYYAAFTALPKMKSESAAELRKVFYCVTGTVGALESIGRPVNNSEDLFVHLTIELLDPRSRRKWENSVSATSEPASYSDLRQFLERRLHTLEALQPARAEEPSAKTNDRSNRSARSHYAQQDSAKRERGRCPMCHQDHYLLLCDEFRKKTAVEKKRFMEEGNLCLNCLGKHKASDCPSRRSCAACYERHHTTIHDAYRAPAIETNLETANPPRTSHAARRPVEEPVAVLLATARVKVRDCGGELHSARALIDQGSEISIVTEALAQRLRLKRTRTSVAVFVVGGQQTGVARGQLSLQITPRDGVSDLVVPAIVLPRLTLYAGVTSVAVKEWPHLQGLELADPEFAAAGDIDILLGAEVYANILGAGVRKGGLRDPVAQQTSLGWIVFGTVGTSASHAATLLHQCSVSEPLSALVRKFWEQEEAPSSGRVLTPEEQDCENFFVNTHSRTREGRYVVRLPVVPSLPDLSGTRAASIRMLLHMERRFERDTQLQVMYKSFLQEYETLGHMTRVGPTGEHEKRACYLPHHGVLREASTTTKLRVVFNGSLTIADGRSLNQQFLLSSNLLPSLADLLLRWRRHRYVFAADIEKMYRQILVHPSDRDLQRIVWRTNRCDPVTEYQLNTVTYGLACAPFLAIRTLHQLAEDERPRFPIGSTILKRDVYMDDVLSGADTLVQARDLQRQLMELCMAGGFPLKKWASNDSSILQDMPEENLAQPNGRTWLPHESHSTLGLHWHPQSDTFTFTIPSIEAKPITKRSALSQAAQLFDLLGWLAPVTVRAKIFIQATWLKGLEWDTPLPPEDGEYWRAFLTDWPQLTKVRVPRWCHWSTITPVVELHGFADASESAYAAVVYLRTKGNPDDPEWTTTLVTAKTKVAPLKQISLPRLELSAATLLVRVIHHVQATLDLTQRPTHLWSDSTVTLGWIRGHPSRWTTYVANRVSEIQTTLVDAHWHHVTSQDNPADCASRGVSPGELASHPLWWHGPGWLSIENEPWRSETEQRETELPEQRTRTHLVQGQDEEPEIFVRYSSLQRLLRITAWCRRWLMGQRRDPGQPREPLTLACKELDQSLDGWIRVVQRGRLSQEINQVQKGRTLSKSNSLAKLNPFVDEQGILRVGGRMKHSLLPFDEKHPIILPKRSHFTNLIIQSCHRRTLHGGVQQTLGLLRQRYWIPCGRAVVKGHIHRCLPCLRWRAASPQPLMSNLPGPRVTPSRPFQHTGVDYAGPILLRCSKGRGQKSIKAFIAVFVCFSTKAVHLEVVTDYTAEAFLAAFRRFVSRRGLCEVMYSDCGTNFVSAEAELRKLFAASGREAQRICTALAEERVRWRFNPPSAPHFGGLWEAAVKSLKHHLRRVIGDSKLTYEEMSTFLSQTEACLNSRPLQPLTDDPEDLTALTPGHFLVGAALLSVPEPTLVDVPVNRLSRWQQVQQMREHFWNRWSQEYLHSLAARPKWWKESSAPKVGQLCLVRNEVTPPTRWPLARITALQHGDGDRVRVVTVKTATSEITRPLVKLVLLPAESSEDSQQPNCPTGTAMVNLVRPLHGTRRAGCSDSTQEFEL
ncbi:PREDICTED: uncharacterized protein LOC105449732 [Wasmannia auropunctata]|uniref:uncharacterized protein LOC105449732 n=1 Tax=Wasmannia auropunctata TaxID=64793 RepID=UPI0005ED69AD|nr:PREDICTED: uncharacterized protein LOC105449732 [Wasmannia auropunctata]